MTPSLTPEQDAVVQHPLGRHARVLAVAGAGKTTTMVARVQHLVDAKGTSPKTIAILMFNRRARLQFIEKLNSALARDRQPEVNTFHSFAYRLIRDAAARGLFPSPSEVWVGEQEHLVRTTVLRSIQELERSGEIPPDAVDVDDALECISLWKGALIPPGRAGHRHNAHLPAVYKAFERSRIAKNALTFDDFVPLAVDLLTEEQEIRARVVNSFAVVIVDEYQDVNFGQQRLLELIAGERADVMVVGDDDQTIYEWRGARPEYITQEFARVFANKAVVDYQLSRTFRFGPVLAQCAQNVIAFNSRRVAKPIIAHNGAKASEILLFGNQPNSTSDTNRELAHEVLALVRRNGDPSNIIVLARLFSQLSGLEAAFLDIGIPYRVLGRAPLFERREIVALLDYLRLALRLDGPIDKESVDLLTSVANVPNRRLGRDDLVRTAKLLAGWGGQSVRRHLSYLYQADETPFTASQRRAVESLSNILERLRERITGEPNLNAGVLLEWLIVQIDYFKHFDAYYGASESAEDRKQAVRAFCTYAKGLGKTVPAFLEWIRTLDTTRGEPEDQQIVMTTVFRVKGEEFDYVVIPDCVEGYLPCLFSTTNEVYDLKGASTEHSLSDPLDNERRLFYVAVTRARKTVLIGVGARPSTVAQSSAELGGASRFLDEIQLEPTQEVMGAFQQVVARVAPSSQQLEQSLCKHAGHKGMVHNLLDIYLPHHGLTLTPEVVQAVENAPPVVYQARVPVLVPSPTKASLPLEVPKKPWWDVL